MKKQGSAERIRRANERRIAAHIRAMADILDTAVHADEELRTEVVRVARVLACQIENREHR